MILKVGWRGPDSIDQWRYFEDFDDLRVNSFLSETHFFNKEKNTLTFEPNEPMEVGKEDGTKEFVHGAIVELDGYDLMFHHSACSVEKTCVTIIEFQNLKRNAYEQFACLSDTVYIMNDNGKTVDKY